MVAKQRSPRHPSISLTEAVEKLKAFYARQGNSLANPEEAVQAWNYKSLNGASARTLASMRQYGLMEDVGSDVRVSPLGLTILLEDEGHPEYASALRQASREPKVFAEILEDFPEGLPSERSLIAHLVRKRGFGEDAAKIVNAVLRETLALVEGSRGESRSDGMGMSFETEQALPRSIQGAQAYESVPTPKNTLSHIGGSSSAATEHDVRLMRYEMTLPNHGKATLLLMGDSLTPEDIEDVYAWLEVMRRTIQRAVQQRPQEISPGL
jgi:hypothetical protein